MISDLLGDLVSVSFPTSGRRGRIEVVILTVVAADKCSLSWHMCSLEVGGSTDSMRCPSHPCKSLILPASLVGYIGMTALFLQEGVKLTLKMLLP